MLTMIMISSVLFSIGGLVSMTIILLSLSEEKRNRIIAVTPHPHPDTNWHDILTLCQKQGMDEVITDRSDPDLVRIMNYIKYLYANHNPTRQTQCILYKIHHFNKGTER